MLPENEVTEVEGRYYLNPQIGLDESTSFIDNLRATQAQQNQQIADQTRMLGTDVSSQLGGLTGGESYFTSRLQTPQTNATVANLRATAQAAALNQALENEQAKWKKRYNDAYRKYQKSAYDKSNPSNAQNPNNTEGGVEEETTDTNSTFEYGGSVSSVPGYYSVIDSNGVVHLVDMETGEETILSPDNTTNTGASGHGWSGGGGGGGGAGGR